MSGTLTRVAALFLLPLFAHTSNVLAAAPIVDEPGPVSSRDQAVACSLLDDPKLRQRMDGLLYKLLLMCNREEELGRILSAKQDQVDERAPGPDVLVNDPEGEFSSSQTQSETSIARNEVTGTLCSGFNDSFSGVTNGGGFTGFARSVDDGQTFSDGGPLSSSSRGDPSIVWRRSDGKFYFAALHNSGLGMWRSDDDCGSFSFIGLIHQGNGDDKEILSVDNNPDSPYYGRLYVSWTDFAFGGRIFNTFSSDGGASWSSPVGLTDSFDDVQGAWPTVAPDGTVYVGWVQWTSYFSGSISIEIARSSDGGVNFERVIAPLAGAVNPYQSAATGACNRPALNGFIRYLPSPQLVVSPNGDLHVVYSYDPDGRDVGDVVDVFYRRSTERGDSWDDEVRLNDDTTLSDQYFPTISVGESGRLVAAWYDRRLDPENFNFDYYSRFSPDGGDSWLESERVSDESSTIYLDPNLATCYHGDYDQHVQGAGKAFVQWSDDRAVRSGHADPDVYLDAVPLAPDFQVAVSPTVLDHCSVTTAEFDVTVGQILEFTDPVTLDVSGLPSGATGVFSQSAVSPPYSSVLSVSAGSAQAGEYQVQVSGTDGTNVRAAQTTYKLRTGVASAVSLVSPSDGSTDVSGRPILSWVDDELTDTFTYSIARDDAFTDVVLSGETTESSVQIPSNLAPLTTYYWRVSGENICGVGPDSASIQFTTSPEVCSDANLSIVDIDTVSDILSVSGEGALDLLSVSLNVNHTWVGDLTVTLTHESTGTSVVLMDRPGFPDSLHGCSSNNIRATFSDSAGTPVENECNNGSPAIEGEVTPDQPLSQFIGESLGGAWRLDVADAEGFDSGVVNSWCLVPVFSSVEDTDADGVADGVDNCTNVSNPDQRDTDSDGHGNLCDFDYTNDCTTNFLDISQFAMAFGSISGGAGYNENIDRNGDGIINFIDFGVAPNNLAGAFGQPPGPSATECLLQAN